MKRLSFVLFGLLCLGLLSGCPSPPVIPPDIDSNISDVQVLSLVNKERNKAGVPPLVLESRLNDCAQKYAELMAKNEKIGHDLGGQTLSMRINESGYRWQSIGENVAFGYPNAASVVNGWMNSSGHRANILNSRYTETGVGIALNKRYYYCQIFADPK